MKVKRNQTKQPKRMEAKLKLGKFKTSKKLVPQQTKDKSSVCKDKIMCTPRDTMTNLVNNMDINDVQNIPLPGESISSPTEKTITQSSFKRRKKQFGNKRIVNESPSTLATQYFTNDSIKWRNSEEQMQEQIDDDWKLDNSEEETEEKLDDNWIQIVPKEQKNTSLPFVKKLSEDFTSLNLPETLQYQQRTKSDKNISYDSDIFRPPSDKEDTCVIFTANVNNTNPSCSSTRHELVETKRPTRRSTDRDTKHTKHTHTKVHSNLKHENARVHECVLYCKRPEIYCIRNIVIVIMEPGSKFCFTGKLLVKILYGAVKIYGAILNARNGVTEVYSPRGYSSITIETSEVFPESSIENVWTALSAENITRDSESKLQVDIDKIQPGTAIIILQNLENNLTHFLKTYSPFRLFPNIKNSGYYSWTDPKRAEIVLQAKLRLPQNDDLTCKRLITDRNLTTNVTDKMITQWGANEWSCTLVAGGKSVGKSTSVRCLINSLLYTTEKVVLLDLDPGQTECTPSGCISYSLIEEPLIGPNFTHLKTPVYQLFIDEVSVARCVTRYLEGVKMLIERLKACPILSHLPIVVNTMGFTQYIGWDLAIFIMKLVRPSIVVQIISSKQKNNYINLLKADIVNSQECTWTFFDETFVDWNRPCDHDICVLYSQAESMKARPNELSLEPYQKRDLMMQSYLSGIIYNSNNSFQCEDAGPSYSINEAVPYIAPFSSLCIIPQRLLGIPASHVLSVINGNIVALCGIDLTEEPSQESESASGLRVLTQRSPLCTCYGFGIIRGIDMERQEIFINTPLPMSMMQHVNCLAGCIPVPPALLQLNQGAPYVGGNATLPTSREPRKGYFRMRYQNQPNKP